MCAGVADGRHDARQPRRRCGAASDKRTVQSVEDDDQRPTGRTSAPRTVARLAALRDVVYACCERRRARDAAALMYTRLNQNNSGLQTQIFNATGTKSMFLPKC